MYQLFAKYVFFEISTIGHQLTTNNPYCPADFAEKRRFFSLFCRHETQNPKPKTHLIVISSEFAQCNEAKLYREPLKTKEQLLKQPKLTLINSFWQISLFWFMNSYSTTQFLNRLINRFLNMSSIFTKVFRSKT